MSLLEYVCIVCPQSQSVSFLGVYIGISVSMMTMAGVRDTEGKLLALQCARRAAKGLDILFGGDRMPTWDALHVPDPGRA